MSATVYIRHHRVIIKKEQIRIRIHFLCLNSFRRRAWLPPFVLSTWRSLFRKYEDLISRSVEQCILWTSLPQPNCYRALLGFNLDVLSSLINSKVKFAFNGNCLRTIINDKGNQNALRYCETGMLMGNQPFNFRSLGVCVTGCALNYRKHFSPYRFHVPAAILLTVYTYVTQILDISHLFYCFRHILFTIFFMILDLLFFDRFVQSQVSCCLADIRTVFV